MLKDRNFVQSTDRELGIISFRGLYIWICRIRRNQTIFHSKRTVFGIERSLYKSVKCYNECVDMIFLTKTFDYAPPCVYIFAFTVTANVISNRKVYFSIWEGPNFVFEKFQSWNRKQLIIFRCTNTKKAISGGWLNGYRTA